MKQIKFALMLFVFNCLLFSQEADFPKLLESDFPGLKITREQYFDGNSLWGYINGGADIFLEYGFDKLLLQEVEINGLTFKIEFYKMINQQSAFGIYSVSHYKCDEKSIATKHNCITQYQVQCAIGDYYISIINSNGSKKEQELSIEIFEKVVSKISGGEFELPEIFHNKLFDGSRDQIKYFKGILGVQNGLIEWYDYFEKFENYEIYYFPFLYNSKSINFAHVRFGTKADLNIFLSNWGIKADNIERIAKKELNGIIRFIKILNETTVIFFESNSNSADINEIIKQIF
ncbi:MAG: hypothetical protein RDU14_16110 [Melioribacteraceae bacterium]|nr:hypothetical protein [Melioribacteraceae bacterium]